MRRSLKLAGVGISVALFAGRAQGVIVGSGDGAQNTLPGQPPSVLGWTNVGSYLNAGTNNPASGVYLGNGWVLAAAHSGAPNAAGITFPTAGTFFYDGTVRALNNADNSASDVRLFHLAANPNLPFLTLSSTPAAVGQQLVMIGFGRNRAAAPSFYNVTGIGPASVWTPAADSASSNAGGFAYAAGNALRWGTNVSNGDQKGHASSAVTDAGVTTQLFAMDFYTGATPAAAKQDYMLQQAMPIVQPEAIGAPGDSGGAVFDLSNRLVGMIDDTGTFENQPSNVAIFGNITLSADLSAYQSQIVTVVPEPGGAALLIGAALGLCARRRK